MSRKKSNHSHRRSVEIVKILIISIVWLISLAISFYTYFTIPFLIFLGWWVVALLMKLTKTDLHDGSAYDEESDRH